MLLSKLKHVVSGLTTRNLRLPPADTLASLKDKKLRLVDLYILKHLETPLTDEQLTRAYNRVRTRSKVTYSTIRRRRSELVRKGYVRDTGTVTKGKYGKNMTVWATTLTN